MHKYNAAFDSNAELATLTRKAVALFSGSIITLIAATDDKKLKSKLISAALANPLSGRASDINDFLAEYQFVLNQKT